VADCLVEWLVERVREEARQKNGKKPGPAVHDDLCVVIDEDGRERHQFVAGRANQLWLTDITEHKTAEGRLYLCAVKDASSGRIVGYWVDSKMKAALAVPAVPNAVARRGNVKGCIVHSDRGSHFRSRKLRHELAGDNLVGSMGRVASCGDNAAIESFFSCCRRTGWIGVRGPCAKSFASRS